MCKTPYYHGRHLGRRQKWKRGCSYTPSFFPLVGDDIRHTYKAEESKYKKSSNVMLSVFIEEKDHFHLGI